MAGTIAFSLSQQLDSLGFPLGGGKLYLFQAGTTTPQSAYQDSALTIPHANPIILDAAGRVPQFFLADGSIKIRLDSQTGVTQLAADGILVIGASSGGGGGSPVDATTVLQTGDLKSRYGTGVHTGWVRLNGRTIGSATSGATERANADTEALFLYLYGADANLAVSGGRGANAAADWAANKTIALPDGRGRVLAALDDMGTSAAGRMSASYFGASGTTLGAVGGDESRSVLQANFPSVNFTVTDNRTVTFGINRLTFGGGAGGTSVIQDVTANAGGNSTALAIISGGSPTAASGGSGTPLATVQPTLLVTNYIKL